MNLYDIIATIGIYGGGIALLIITILYIYSKKYRIIKYTEICTPDIKLFEPIPIRQQINTYFKEKELLQMEEENKQQDIMRLTLLRQKEIELRSKQRYTIVNNLKAPYYRNVVNYY